MIGQAAVLDNLDVLVERGIYRDREALAKDAMQALLRSRPELRRHLAIELYRQEKVSLSRAAEIGGLDIESFKESLREAGIARLIAPVGSAVHDEIDVLMRVRVSRASFFSSTGHSLDQTSLAGTRATAVS